MTAMGRTVKQEFAKLEREFQGARPEHPVSRRGYGPAAQARMRRELLRAGVDPTRPASADAPRFRCTKCHKNLPSPIAVSVLRGLPDPAAWGMKKLPALDRADSDLAFCCPRGSCGRGAFVRGRDDIGTAVVAAHNAGRDYVEV